MAGPREPGTFECRAGSQFFQQDAGWPQFIGLRPRDSPKLRPRSWRFIESGFVTSSTVGKDFVDRGKTLKVAAEFSDSRVQDGNRSQFATRRFLARSRRHARFAEAGPVSTGSEFADRRPCGEESRADEKFVRILFIEDRTDVADEIRGSLGRAGRGSFDVVCEKNLVKAIAQIEGDRFDLLLLDLSLQEVHRATAIELANDLAHHLPVVVLTGTEVLGDPDSSLRKSLKTCIERANVPAKLLAAIRHSRRLGTGVMTPLFCRIKGLCG